MIIGSLMLPFFFAVLVVHILAYVLHTRPTRRLDGQLQNIDREIARLRQEAKDMFSPHQFAKSAKIERQANALEKKKRGLGKSGPSARIKYMMNIAKMAVICSGLYMAWRAPIGNVPLDLVQPFSRRASAPWTYSEEDGVTEGRALVSMISWLMLADRLASACVEAVDATTVY
eukprot:jgi/Ulvmu1/2822/UM142_0020.1